MLGILLPVGFVSAYLAIPKPVADKIENYSRIEPYEKIVNSASDEFFHANFRQTPDGAILQIEIFIKKPLTVPSAVVYLSNAPEPPGLESLKLLGALGSKGVYRFNFLHDLDLSTGYYLLFYDFIKKEKFHSLKIQ